MVNYNSNIAGTYLNTYKVPFKGANNAATSPIEPNEEPAQQQELASKEYAYATRATAMAQIKLGGVNQNTTKEEYINTLINQGKVQNKDFIVLQDEAGTVGENTTRVIELNNKRQEVKRVIFWSKEQGGGVGVRFVNPETQQCYKALEYASSGGVEVAYSDPITGEALIDESYRPDGSLKASAYYKKTPTGETSVNGDYIIYGVDGPPAS